MRPRQYALILLSNLLVLFGLALNANAAISGKDLLTEKTIEIAPGKKGTVIVFLSAKCPCSNSHVRIMKKLAADFNEITFVAVHSNADEGLALSRPYFKTADFPFPVIEDDKDKLADKFKALKTPHAFLISPAGKILYKGGVTSSTSGETADKHFLRDALSDVTAGRAVKVAEGRTLGCAISRGEKHVW